MACPRAIQVGAHEALRDGSGDAPTLRENRIASEYENPERFRGARPVTSRERRRRPPPLSNNGVPNYRHPISWCPTIWTPNPHPIIVLQQQPHYYIVNHYCQSIFTTTATRLLCPITTSYCGVPVVAELLLSNTVYYNSGGVSYTLPYIMYTVA
jgi:hypothetical protein